MSTFTRLFIAPSRLEWWEWGYVAGAAGLVGLGVSAFAGYIPPPLVVALVLHVAADFFLQSGETARLKGERGRHLAVHALVAGGLPLALAGLAAGSPTAVLAWAACGAAGHYLVDWTRKFGLRRLALGVCLDQACHLALLLMLTLPWK